MALDVNEMRNMQAELQEKYLAQWGGVHPRRARDQLLWMLIEAGEAADIIKKQGDDAIMDDASARHAFTEEMCDVMMYFHDVLLCYGITPEEFEQVYREKHERNMHRWE